MMRMPCRIVSVHLAAAQSECEVETMFAQVRLLRDEVLHGEIVMDFPFLQDNRPGAEVIEEEEIVTDANECSREFPKHLEEELLLLWVEISGWFIENEDFGIHGEGRRKGRPLFLSIAQVMGGLVSEAFETNLLESHRDPAFNLQPVQSLIQGSEGDVFIECVAKKLVIRVLKEHPDSQPCSGKVCAFQRLPFVENLAAARSVQTVQMLCKSGFPRPVLADEGDFVSGVDFEIDAIQGPPAISVVKDQGSDAEQKFRLLPEGAKCSLIVASDRVGSLAQGLTPFQAAASQQNPLSTHVFI